MEKILEVNKNNQPNVLSILIEEDAGYISSQRNEGLIREMNERTIDFTQPIYVYATLQKYGDKNRNGRVYPKDILMREVTRYMDIIKRNASFHELDHPDCYSDDTEILTNKGWVLFSNLMGDELIQTLNQETNQIELQPITNNIIQEYTGNMISIRGRNIDLLVTPNHKFWIINKRTLKGKFVTAKDIKDHNIKSMRDYYIPKQGVWVGEEEENFILRGITENVFSKNKTRLFEKYSKDIAIDSVAFFRFIGIWLAEGSVQDSNGGQSGYKVHISQKKPAVIALIREVLNKLPFHFSESENNGKIDFYCNDARLHAYLKPLGNSLTKYVPTELKNASPMLLTELFEYFLLGDGRKGGTNGREVFSTSKKLIDDLHEILIKIGGSGNIKCENRKKNRYVGNRLISGKNSHDMWFLNISTTNGVWLDPRMLTIEYVKYNNNIYCVEVPNHILYVRRNGKAVWSGNSSIISLKGGSPHRIVDMWWEGNILIGKLEILVSRGYRESGIISCDGDLVAHYLSYGMTLGISSRGIGSLKKINGENVVQDDFELICWDIVSSPSVPGSYLYDRPEDYKKYDEDLKDGPQNLTNSNKKDKFDDVFNRFLNFKK